MTRRAIAAAALVVGSVALATPADAHWSWSRPACWRTVSIGGGWSTVVPEAHCHLPVPRRSW